MSFGAWSWWSSRHNLDGSSFVDVDDPGMTSDWDPYSYSGRHRMTFGYAMRHDARVPETSRDRP